MQVTFFFCLVFQQVLASRESLADSLEESESDDINLMNQVLIKFLISQDKFMLFLPTFLHLYTV